jgi:tricorn protease
MNLGPLIGTRTWGGVIGIARRFLVDWTATSQPEYAHWYPDLGWNLENRGTDPDIVVEMAPQDYTQDRDPQLERAIVECLKLVETSPKDVPEPGERPLKVWPRG